MGGKQTKDVEEILREKLDLNRDDMLFTIFGLKIFAKMSKINWEEIYIHKLCLTNL